MPKTSSIARWLERALYHDPGIRLETLYAKACLRDSALRHLSLREFHLKHALPARRRLRAGTARLDFDAPSLRWRAERRRRRPAEELAPHLEGSPPARQERQPSSMVERPVANGRQVAEEVGMRPRREDLGAARDSVRRILFEFAERMEAATTQRELVAFFGSIEEVVDRIQQATDDSRPR